MVNPSIETSLDIVGKLIFEVMQMALLLLMLILLLLSAQDVLDLF